jgi:N-carbamoylputrescine amidase
MGSMMCFMGARSSRIIRTRYVQELDRVEEGFRIHDFDLKAIGELRRSWGIFWDRRTDLYDALLTKNGHTQ